MVPWMQSSSNSTGDEEFTNQGSSFDSNTGKLEKDDPSDTLISSLSSVDDVK